MAKIKQQPQQPWPWGGPKAVRERLVDRTQLNKKKTGKKGDPKNPALASMALLDSIGPADSAESLRMPMPPMPAGHDADLATFSDHPYLAQVAERAEEQAGLEAGLLEIRVSPERAERLKSILSRERQMLELVAVVKTEMDDIKRRRHDEQQGEGY